MRIWQQRFGKVRDQQHEFFHLDAIETLLWRVDRTTGSALT